MQRLAGVIAAAATPVKPDFSIDLDRLAGHCEWLLAHGCDGINLLGTTGEATSFSVTQRLAAMEAVARAGLPLERMMVGTGAAALADAIQLTATAKRLGYAGALLLPPFYYKGISDDGLAAYVEAVIQGAGPDGLRLYLYHFPQNSAVPYPADVVARLRDRHPEVLLGLKDSSGDLAYSEGLARRLPGFDVFPSAEGAIGRAAAAGFAGCISATANITGPFAGLAWAKRGSAEAAAALEKAVAIRSALGSVSLIAAVKWALADLRNDATWRLPCLPLRPLGAPDIEKLRAALKPTAYASLHESF